MTEPLLATDVKHSSHLGMAERLVRLHGNNLLHAHDFGWLTWDGRRWSRDRDGAAMRYAIATVKAAFRELEFLDDKERNALYADIRRSESASGLEGMLRIAGSLYPIAVATERLDGDPYLFNTMDGTLDLRTGEVVPHSPSHRITKLAGCGLGSEPGPVLLDFLAEVLPDSEVRSFVQRLIGYTMLGITREHVLPIFTGTGRNGKTTLLNVVAEAFGDYAIAAEPEMLIERGNSHPTGQADLLGVRLATTAETDEGRALAAATVKRLTGGEKIRARRMRQDFFEFEPSHTLIMVTNHKPRVSGDDPALWRRIHVVPFDVVVDADKVDTHLPERLSAELPGVLAWVYEGYRSYTDLGGLMPPDAVCKRTAAYQTASDALGRFLEERTLVLAAGYVRARDLYAAWTNWSHVNGETSGSEVDFSSAMGRRGHEKKRRSIGQVYPGLALLADERDGGDADDEQAA